jgi:arginyl-tRNA synthetase
MVRLLKEGKEFKLSKRTGNGYTLAELIEDVGVDAARYIFVSRSADSHLEVDLDLLQAKSLDNPVYYVQYAHARCKSLLKTGERSNLLPKFHKFELESKQQDLIRTLLDYPQVIKGACIDNAPNQICLYLKKLAGCFHSFYGANKIIDTTNSKESEFRLLQVLITSSIIKDGLGLIGVDAPETM